MSSKIMILWGGIVVLICAFLLVAGNNLKDKTLIRLERSLKEEAYKYIQDNNKKLKYNESFVIFPEELPETQYIIEENLEKYCVKKIIVIKDIIFYDYKIIKECDHVLTTSE